MNSKTELAVNITSLSHTTPPQAWQKIVLSAKHSQASGVNELVDQAGNIFAHLYSISEGNPPSNIGEILQHALEKIQQQYKKSDSPEDTALAAHYLLCATVDDLLHCAHRHDGQFLQKFHQSHVEQEKFYSILEHVSKKPEQYLDLLELIYLCLRFGYKGAYRQTPFGLQQWSLIIDNLYHLIMRTRGQHPHYLSPSLSSLPPTASANLTPPMNLKPQKPSRFYLKTAIISIVISIILGFVFRETYEQAHHALITTSTTQGATT